MLEDRELKAKKREIEAEWSQAQKDQMISKFSNTVPEAAIKEQAPVSLFKKWEAFQWRTSMQSQNP